MIPGLDCKDFNYHNNILPLDIRCVSSLPIKKDFECNGTDVEFSAILHCLFVPADAVVIHCFRWEIFEQL